MKQHKIIGEVQLSSNYLNKFKGLNNRLQKFVSDYLRTHFLYSLGVEKGLKILKQIP